MQGRKERVPVPVVEITAVGRGLGGLVAVGAAEGDAGRIEATGFRVPTDGVSVGIAEGRGVGRKLGRGVEFSVGSVVGCCRPLP